MFDLASERAAFARGFRRLGALDEAGRGPLAGPVVAACVVLVPGFVPAPELAGVKDSKKLSPKRRQELYEIIVNELPAVGIGACEAGTIDRINILQAAYLAMKKAIGAVRAKPDHIMIDGPRPLPNYSSSQEALINGDNLVFGIAAASIVAKVERDRIMELADQEFPQYGFGRHKGYGTREHLAALKEHGPCSWHRQSFAPVKKAVLSDKQG